MNEPGTQPSRIGQYQVSRAPLIVGAALPGVNNTAEASPSATVPGTSETTDAMPRGGLSTAEKAGIGVGVGGFVFIVAAVILLLCRRRRRTAGDSERGKDKRRARHGSRRRKHKADNHQLAEPKPVHSPSTTKSTPHTGGSPIPSPTSSPPPIRPKSSKRPPSLPIIPRVSIDESPLSAATVPDVPEKSAKRRTLLAEEADRPRTAPAVSQSTEGPESPLFSGTLESAEDSSLRPLPLFSPAPEALGRISEDSKERSGRQTPEVPAKAAARISMVSTTTTMIDSSGLAVEEAEVSALRAENDRLKRETRRLREMLGDSSESPNSERGST